MILMVVNRVISPAERISNARLELNLSNLDASKDTELVLNSSWHFIGIQVHVIFQRLVIK